MEPLPRTFAGEDELDEFMTRPEPGLVEDLAAVPGDILVLGAGGKMGPTLCRLAKRAAPDRRVVAVARFSKPDLETSLRRFGIDTIACDLLDSESLARLPDCPNVIFMVARKFGSTGAEDATWEVNVLLAARVAERFRASRIIAFSTGCVYPYMPVASGGADETVPPTPPPGDYAWSCVGRERAFLAGSRRYGTPGRLIRLNYAIDMRYGVLHDVAGKVWRAEPIDLTMGHVNVIWQGDACAMALRALRHVTVPTSPLNVTGPETVSVRRLAQCFGRLLQREPVLVGSEAPDAWLADASQAFALFGYPRVPLAHMIAWQADWTRRGLPTLGKPTRFEVRDGRF